MGLFAFEVLRCIDHRGLKGNRLGLVFLLSRTPVLFVEVIEFHVGRTGQHGVNYTCTKWPAVAVSLA
jgi:hypothetical protein